MKTRTSTMSRHGKRWWNVLLSVCLLTMAFSSAAGASNALAPLAGTVTKTDAIIGDDGDSKADPGETIEYTVVIPNVGTTATGVEFDDDPDPNTTFVGGSLVASPVAVNDTYPQTVIGNVSINSALIPYSVVSNDFLGLNPTATISAFDAISANDGTVTMTTSGAGMGQFTYNPPAGFEGTDTFTYTLTDHANASSAVANRTATVSIPISGMVWFINNSASLCIAAGCGRLSNPFSTLAAFNTLNNGISNNPASNDNIFVYESAAQYTGAVTLLSGQKLIGQDATATLSTITGLTPPGSSAIFPAMNSANGTVTNIGSTVTLNTNATVRGLQINSTTNTGMNDPGGAITGVSVSDISVSSTTGTAVSLSDVGGTFVFTSISSNGGTSDGISLTNTTGSFTVNGDGSNTSVGGNSSGGTIANKSGADGSTSSGIGVYLSNVQNVTLRRITINGTNQNFGIRGFRVNNFTLEYSTVNGLQGDSAAFDNYGEGSVMFGDDASTTTNGMTGTGTITNSIFSGGAARNFSVVNTAGTLNRLTITGSTFGLNQSTGNSALAVEARNAGTVANVTVTGSTFTGSPGDAGNFTGQTGTTMDVVFGGVTGTRGTAPGNTITNTHPNNNIGGSNLTFATQGVMNFHALGNTMSGANGSAVTFFKASAATVMNGYFDNNEIGNSAVVNSGSATGNGIFVSAGGTGTMSYTITNNLIHRVNGNFHISADNTGGSYTANFDIRGNLFDTPGAGNAGAIGMTNGSPTSSDTVNVCAVIGSSSAADKNTLTGFPAAGQSIFLGSSGAGAGHTFNLPGLPSSTETTVQNFVAVNNNMGGTVVDAYADAPATFAAFTGVGTSCSTPISMLPNNTQQLAQVNREANHGHSAEASTNLSSTNVFKQTSYTFTNDSSNTNVAPVTDGIGSMSSKPQFAPLQAGGIVSVNIGTLPVGKSVTIKFQVTVNGPSLPLGTFQLSNQGTVSGSNFSNVLTDDPAAGGTSDPTITLVDRPDTTVTSINRAGSDPTNASPVSWTVTFADAVLNLTSSNLTLVNGGLGGTPAITGVTAIGVTPATQWTVTASTGTGDGTLGLNMTSDTGLSHDVTNLTFTGQVYTFDRTPPTVAVSSAAPNPTNTSPIPVTAQFSETVNNFIATDIVVSNATVGNFIAVDGDTYTFELTPSGQGPVTADVPAGVAQDSAGNGNTAATQFSRTFDSAPPTVTITSATSDPTNANPIPVTAQFSETVNNFIATDVVAVNATVGNFIAVDGDTYTFDLTPSGDGLVTADIASGVATDTAGNGNTAATQFSRTFDSAGPTVTMSSAAPDPTNTSPIPVTAQFSEAVTDFIASDITPGNATVGNFIAVDGDTYTFDLTPSGQGLVTADIPAGVAQDSGGNGNTAAAQFSHTFDTVAPTVTMNSAVPDPTNTSPISVTAQFSENVTGFDVGEITPGNATVGNFIAVDSDTYTFELTPSAPGLVTADIASGVAQDAAGNLNTAAAQFSRTFDSDNPTVAMSSAAPNPTNTSPIPVTVQFSENVTGFDVGDITSGNGTLGNFLAVDGDTYTFTLTPSGQGPVTADIAAGVAQDSGGNFNSPASQFSRTFDTVAPTVTIDQAADQADPASASAINFTVIFNEPVSGFGDSAGDVTLSGTAGATTAVVTEIAPNDDTTYNVAVSGMTSSGTVIASIPVGSALDAAGNGNTAASTSTDNTVTFILDTTPPNVSSVNRAEPNPTSAASVNFTVMFSESVTGVDPSDFTLTTTGVSGATVGGVSGSGTTYTVTANTGSGEGTIRLDVLDDDTIIDAANNPLAGGFTGGEVYTIIESSAFANVQVNIAGSNIGNFSVAPDNSMRQSFAGLNNGPVSVISTNSIPIVASARVAYFDGSAWTSFSEMMGLPSNQLTTSYTFPWYNNLDLNSQLRFGNVGTADTIVTVTIGGIPQGSYTLAPNQSTRVSYPGLNNGPVTVTSSGNVPIIASMRVAYFDGSAWTSFSEMMGLPSNKLTHSYVFPWYNNLDLNSQLRFGNVGTTNTTVTVTIGGIVRGSYNLAPNTSQRVSYLGLNSGPVVIQSSGNIPIIASMRVAYFDATAWTDFSEMMGLPSSSLSTHYSFPHYNNVDLNSQLRFGNLGNVSTTVTVTINGVLQGSYVLAPNASQRISYVGLDAGPVVIQSSGNVPIIASERVAYFNGTVWTSFAELMGLPQSQLTTTYLFPWYNNVDINSQLRFGVP